MQRTVKNLDHARHAIKRIIAKGMVGMVGTPGLEPGRPIKPTDFKSVVFTNFTMPPKKQLASSITGVCFTTQLLCG